MLFKFTFSNFSCALVFKALISLSSGRTESRRKRSKETFKSVKPSTLSARRTLRFRDAKRRVLFLGLILNIIFVSVLLNCFLSFVDLEAEIFDLRLQQRLFFLVVLLSECMRLFYFVQVKHQTFDA